MQPHASLKHTLRSNLREREKHKEEREIIFICGPHPCITQFINIKQLI